MIKTADARVLECYGFHIKKATQKAVQIAISTQAAPFHALLVVILSTYCEPAPKRQKKSETALNIPLFPSPVPTLYRS